MELQDQYRASVVFDENEEYDSEEEEGGNDDGPRKSKTRRSFKKGNRPSVGEGQGLRDSLKKVPKLTDLVGMKAGAAKYQVEDAIEERSHT